MRPLSIVYVVLALYPLGEMWLANWAINTNSTTVSFPSMWQRHSLDAGVSALVFAVTVFLGEAYRSCRSRFKKVPMLSVPLSNAYIVLMLLTVGPVIATVNYVEWDQPLPPKNSWPETSTLLWWAMVSAGAFVVNALASEIYLHRSRKRTSNTYEAKKTQEEEALV